MNGGRPDPFAFTKAIHKAQRNAIKQLLPVPVIREVLNFYLKRKVDIADTEQPPQAEQTNDNISNVQKAAFAIASKLEPLLQEKEISKNEFWNYVKVKFSVESRNDMSEQQWTELSAQLKAAETTPKLFEELTKQIKEKASGEENSA